MGKIAAGVGMFAFGAIALLVPGFLFQARLMRPLPSTPHAAETTGPSGRIADRSAGVPSAALAGILTDLQTASDLLDRDRPGAAARLDAANRVADVLRYATPSPSIERIYKQVSEARRRMQNGDRTAAAMVADDVAETLRGSLDASRRPKIDYDRYAGARAIDAVGHHQGTVVSADDRRLVLETSSWRNLLGFVDFSEGRSLEFPSADVLFGEPRMIGSRLVVITAVDSGAGRGN